MTVLAAATNDPTNVLLWCGVTAVVLLAMAGGFFAGLLCAPLFQEWAVRRASAQIHRMYELVMTEVERAHRMCAQLAAVSGARLSPLEWQRMDRVQREFQETFAQLAKSCGIRTNNVEGESAKPKEFAVEWAKTPADPISGLPDKQAFDVNLEKMVSLGAESGVDSGLLLVRMDKADGLRRRLGHDAVEKLLARLVSLIVRTARDQDLVCRLSSDTLGLLLPALPPLAGSKIAERIRETVRNHHFRVHEGGPEVLVTASFGYANCGPADSAEVARERASDGLARSQSLGRNQLHVHDGQLRALCRA